MEAKAEFFCWLRFYFQ